MTVNRSLSVWLLRVLLAALFLFAGEIILWLNIQSYGVVDWSIRIIGYLLLATLVLDVAVRYRIRDVYDAMILLTTYALLHSLIINPETGWQRIPDSLITQVIGGEALSALIIWGVFLVVLRGDDRKYHLLLIGGVFWLGFYWGTIMHWTPLLRGTFQPLAPDRMFAIAGGIFLQTMLLYGLCTYLAKDVQPTDNLLTPLGWGIALLVLIVLFLYQAILGTVTSGALGLSAVLLVLCWLTLWSRRDEVQISLMEKHLPLKALHPLWIALIVLVFVAATIFAYLLPLARLAQFNQLWLMELGSFVAGILWLPFVATVLAMRGMDRAMREGPNF